MHDDLAAWLESQYAELLPRWADLVATPYVSASNGHSHAVLTPLAIDTSELYNATIAAARDDLAPLAEQLRSLALAEGDGTITSGVVLAHALRQSTVEWLRATVSDPGSALTLSEALATLFERTIAMLVETWSAHTRAIITEREFIAESLEFASAAADKRTLQLQSLNVISRQLSSILDEEQIINLVVTSVHNLTGVAHVALWQPTSPAPATAPAEEQVLTLVARQTAGAELHPVAGMQLPGNHETDLVVRALRSAAIQFEMAPDPARQGPWLQPGCGVLAFPMVVGARAVAVAVLQDPDPINQLRLQQDLAQGVIGQAAIALQNARLYAEVRALNIDLEQRVVARTRELQDEKDRLATIYQISTEVSSTLDLDMLLTTSLKLLADITRAEHAAVMLVDQPDRSLLVTRAVFGTASNPERYIPVPIGSGIAGWVVQSRSSVLVEDLARDARGPATPESSPQPRQGSLLAVPLVVQGDVLGVILLTHHQAGFFHEDHLRMLNACAGAIAIGVNNANLFQTISAEYERRSELLHQQRTEASKINAILQSLNDGVIVCDLYGGVLAVNAAAGPILQRKVEDLVLWNLHAILARYLGPRTVEMPLDELLRRPLSKDNRPRIFTTTMPVGVRTVSLTLGPVLKDDGELLGALLVLRDITREIESDRMKTEFIGTMSHELRTPMTAIKGFTQLLLMGGLGPLTATQREFVTTIYDNTERMIALINDVLDITKIESGSVDLEWRSLHLAEALSGVIAELKGLTTDRGHELTISIPPGLPLVRGDAHRLHQILYNLLTNAVKYTPRGGRVWVEAREAVFAELPDEVRDELVEERRYLQVSVCDTGVGISSEDLPHIFDRFYRAENPLKIEAGGTGLGLSLAKPLVHLLGGRLWVQSVPGEGSTFSFVLPAAEQR